MANMLITVTGVGKVEYKTKGKNKWSEFTVDYLGDKGDKNKRFMSFSKDQYALGKTLEEGKSYEISLEKDGDYWNWVAAEEVNEEQVEAKPAQAAVKGKAAGNTWDLKNQLDRERFEFYKEKQITDFRQSMVAAAVEFQQRNDAQVEDVLKTADSFVQYIIHGLEEDSIEVDEDIPDEEAPKPRGRPKKAVEVE